MQKTMKMFENVRHSLTCCFAPTPSLTSASISSTATAATSTAPIITIKNRMSATINDILKDLNLSHRHDDPQEDQDSLIDAAASLHHHHHPPSPHHHRSSTIVGTIFGRRRGHVSFCVQSDPSTPPPFLFELFVPTSLLAKEMNSGLLRIALECHRTPLHSRHCPVAPAADHPNSSASASASRRSASPNVWKAYCNGRNVGYAMRRKPSDRDKAILEMVKSMSAGAGVLLAEEADDQEGELLYMRACYERVVGSRDSVSYHLINPGGSPEQELSVFLLRTG